MDHQQQFNAGPVNCNDSELSIYLQALAEGYLPTFYSDTSQSAQSKSMSIASKYFRRGKKTVVFHGFPSLKMSRHSTDDHGAELLTSWLEASRARTLARQGEAMVSTVSAVGCGRKWLGLLARYDPGTRSWRTPQSSLVEGLDEFSETWPRWGSMRNGECWERMTAVENTAESESGLWPTPNCNGYRSDGELVMLARKCKNYQEYRVMSERAASSKRDRYWAPEPHEPGFRLSLNWSEQLMGRPLGQTALRPLETDKFHEWQQQHGPC